MDVHGSIISLLLFIQMTIVLVMLNPVYDARKITSYITFKLAKYKTYILLFSAIYFCAVIYIGIYTPFQAIVRLIFWGNLDKYEKLLLLNRIEKNCVMTGFSLFLVIVLFGVKSLLSYTASLVEFADKQSMSHSHTKFLKPSLAQGNIPNVLKAKRSLSYETILFAKDYGDQMNQIMKNSFIQKIQEQTGTFWKPLGIEPKP